MGALDAAGADVHVSSSPAIWYAARASGVAAYVVLSVVVSLGLTLGGKAQNRRWPRFSVEDVHRFGGLLVGSLIGVHVLAIAADSFLPFSLTQLVDDQGEPVVIVPGNKTYQYQQSSAQLYGFETQFSLHPTAWRGFSFDNAS